MAYNPIYYVVYRQHGQDVAAKDVFEIDKDLKKGKLSPDADVDLLAIHWMYSGDERNLGLTYKSSTLQNHMGYVRDAIMSARRNVLANGGPLQEFAEEVAKRLRETVKQTSISQCV